MRAVHDPGSSHPPPKRSSELVRRYLWLGVLAVAVVELVGASVIRSRVPADDDYRRAGGHLLRAIDEEDGLAWAPHWIGPLVRESLDHRVEVGQVAYSDVEAFERLWVVSIRGRRSPFAPDRPADFEKRFGRVRLSRFDLGESAVVYDFREHLREAEVSATIGGRPRPCPWGRGPQPPGRLGGGPMAPAERFVCDPRRPHLWVGETVVEALDLRGRACIWQHPAGEQPITVTYADVPLAPRLVVYAGLDYHHERQEQGAPYELAVSIDGEPVGTLVHRDGEGWKRMEIDLDVGPTPFEPRRGTVSFSTTSARPHRRSACWTASLRAAPREAG